LKVILLRHLKCSRNWRMTILLFYSISVVIYISLILFNVIRLYKMYVRFDLIHSCFYSKCLWHWMPSTHWYAAEKLLTHSLISRYSLSCLVYWYAEFIAYLHVSLSYCSNIILVEQGIVISSELLSPFYVNFHQCTRTYLHPTLTHFHQTTPHIIQCKRQMLGSTHKPRKPYRFVDFSSAYFTADHKLPLIRF